MGELGRLRHLYLPELNVRSLGRNSKLRFNGLSKLETLENFDTRWCEVKDLPKLISLQKLRLKVRGSYNDVNEMMKYLAAIAFSSSSCLQYLALSLSIRDPRWENGPDILRKLLWDYKSNLRELNVSTELPELAQLFEQQQLHDTPVNVSLIRISILNLWRSCLKEDPMAVLEKIPTLRNLSLWGKTFMGNEMVCSATGFPKLTYLLLEDLPNLEKWRVEEGSMPVLFHLFIDKCQKLQELPGGLIFLNALRILRLEEMPSDFCDRLRVVNGEQGADCHKVAHISTLYLDAD